MGLTDDTASAGVSDPEPTSERLRKIEDIPTTAIERFADKADIALPESPDDKRSEYIGVLSDEQFQQLIHQYRYAGNQTLNYFVITGISDQPLKEIADACVQEISARSDMEGTIREPFIADTERVNDRLYLMFGYLSTTGSEDPITGRRTHDFVTKRCVGVVRDDMDLVEFRVSGRKIAEKARGSVLDALGMKSNNCRRPDFNMEFQNTFGELVDKYYNLRIQVNDEDGSTVDTIKFTSKKDETGERKDARQDKRVTKELDENGGEITMGYVEIEDGSKFHINRKTSRLSFQKYEMEQKINEITGLIDDVLRETGGYKQTTLAGLRNLPE